MWMPSEWTLLESNDLYKLSEDARPGAPFRYMAEAGDCNGFGQTVSAALHDLSGELKWAYRLCSNFSHPSSHWYTKWGEYARIVHGPDLGIPLGVTRADHHPAHERVDILAPRRQDTLAAYLVDDELASRERDLARMSDDLAELADRVPDTVPARQVAVDVDRLAGL